MGKGNLLVTYITRADLPPVTHKEALPFLHPWWCSEAFEVHVVHPGIISTQPLLSLSASHTSYFHMLLQSWSYKLGLTKSQIQTQYPISWTWRRCPKSWQTPNAQRLFQMEISYFPLAHPSPCFPIKQNWAPMISQPQSTWFIFEERHL